MLLPTGAALNGRSVVCKSLRGGFAMCVAARSTRASRSRPAHMLRRTHRTDGERRALQTCGCRHIDRCNRSMSAMHADRLAMLLCNAALCGEWPMRYARPHIDFAKRW